MHGRQLETLQTFSEYLQPPMPLSIFYKTGHLIGKKAVYTLRKILKATGKLGLRNIPRGTKVNTMPGEGLNPWVASSLDPVLAAKVRHR